MREKNIEMIFFQSKNEKNPYTKKILNKIKLKNQSEKDETKTRHPQMIVYDKKVTVVILGI